MTRYILVFASVLLLAAGAHAHHSVTHFSDEFTEMEGRLVDLKWRNPHVYFYLEVEEENGSSRIWEMEAGTIYMIGRAGVTRDMFTIGDEIRVAGNMSNVYDDKFWLTNVLLPDGREVLVVARGEPRWADEIIGGRDQWSNAALHDDYTNDADEGIFRVWSPPGPEAGIVVQRDPEQRPLADIATASSRAVRETWDPYAFDEACERAGVPRVNFGPHPHQFIEDGDDILLLSEEFDLTRTFHMNSDLDPEDQPFSPLGISVGRWENDNTLVVETSRVNFPYMNLGGYGQSEQMRMTEVYTLNEDETQLHYKVTITDPVMLTAPYIQTGVWVDLGEGMVGYDCVATTDNE
jgi:hypothetical protein